MYRKHSLYPAFERDLNTLREQVGPNKNLEALADSTRRDRGDYDEQRRIVDRLDESLSDNALRRNIRVSYGLHGKKNY